MHNPRYETLIQEEKRLLPERSTYFAYEDTLVKEFVVCSDTYLLDVARDDKKLISYCTKHHPELFLQIYSTEDDCSVVLNPDPCLDYILEYAREKMCTIPVGTVIEWNKRIFPLAHDISVIREDDLPEKWRRFVIADWIEGFLPVLTSTHNLLDTHEASFDDTIVPVSPCVFNIYTVEYRVGENTHYLHNAVSLPNIAIGNSTHHRVNTVKSRYITTTEKIESLQCGDDLLE